MTFVTAAYDSANAMSPMPAMPRSTPDDTAAFLGLVPPEPTVTTRPMFGNMAAFVNGNMFAGLFGDQLFVRLPGPERERVLKEGGRDFEPLPGRAMTGYTCLPPGWKARAAASRTWIAKALESTGKLPAKKAAVKGGSKKAAGRAAPVRKASKDS